MKFTLRFEMLSDWHVGAGFGRPGNVDRLLIRDPDDLPYLPAKTIRGMWRDAAERLARGLDSGAVAGPWQQLVDSIFGSQPQLGENDPGGRHADPVNRPRGTMLLVTPARLPLPLRQKLIGKQAERVTLRAALSFVKPGVAIDEKNGRAVDQCLRFEEMGRTGTTLTARAEFPDDWGPRFDAARALMLAATRLITRIGGKRRRGAGKCKVTAEGADVAAAIAFLKGNPACPTAGNAGGVDDSPVPTGPGSANTEWIAMPLTVTLHGAVAVPARTVGNIAETLDFVPGTFFLPHVTRVLQGLGVDARAAIARGDIRVLNATLDVGGDRGRPVPMNLFAPKGKSFEHAKNRFLTDPEPDGQDKQLREGYITPGYLRKTPKHVGTHNVIEDGPQRPTQAVGGVYSLESIAPVVDGKAVILRTELRLRKGSVPDSFDWAKFTGNLRLGSSKKDDYGDATITAGCEPLPSTPPQIRNGELFVWLLSDVLLRGEGLQPEPTVGALAKELKRLLGVELKVEKCFVRVRRTESWQTGWGLPRASLVGLQAGSCVKFMVAGKIAPSALAETEATGLGERTAEGFGEVSFNHLLLATCEHAADWKASDVRPAPGASADRDVVSEPADIGTDTARHIERAAWRGVIRVAALAATTSQAQRADRFKWQPGKPNMSQLGGLRSTLQFLRKADDQDRVLDWLKAVGENRKREDKWPNGSLNTLAELIKQPDRVWEILRAVPHLAWPTLGRTEAELKTELWAFAVRALLDAAIRAHKRVDEKGAKNGA